jgi:hypothetical protein
MRMLDYDADAPLRRVGLLLTPAEAESLLAQLQALVGSGSGYARLEDAEWGDVDVSLYTPETMPFIHRRIRRLIETGE